jgi:MFS family permease
VLWQLPLHSQCKQVAQFMCLMLSNCSNSAFALTIYTAGISQIMVHFKVSMTVSILGFSVYLIGIAFAPIYTPHLSERFGRRAIYFCSLPICAMFLIGTGASQSFAALAVCRFFAGFAGGPCLVLIEGTFADVWSATHTVTYYSFLTLASYIGAACGMNLLISIQVYSNLFSKDHLLEALSSQIKAGGGPPGFHSCLSLLSTDLAA